MIHRCYKIYRFCLYCEKCEKKTHTVLHACNYHKEKRIYAYVCTRCSYCRWESCQNFLAVHSRKRRTKHGRHVPLKYRQIILRRHVLPLK